MKVVYETDRVKLICGDALDALDVIEDESIDLIVTDPPYGVKWRSGLRQQRFDEIAGDDGSLDVEGLLAAYAAKLREGRHLYAFGRATWDLKNAPLSETAELVWDKLQMGSGDLKQPWGPSHERITFAVKIASEGNRDRGSGRLAARLRRGSVLRHQRLNALQVDLHPTEKPVALLRELIEASSLIGETVLDPFAGSGSTLEAALLEGRSAIGIEIDAGWCERIAERLGKYESALF